MGKRNWAVVGWWLLNGPEAFAEAQQDRGGGLEAAKGAWGHCGGRREPLGGWRPLGAPGLLGTPRPLQRGGDAVGRGGWRPLGGPRGS